MSYHNYEQKIADLEEEIERLEGENENLLILCKIKNNQIRKLSRWQEKEPNEEN